MANLNPILKHYSQLRRIKREKMNAGMHVIDEMYQIAHIENRFKKLNMKKKQIKLIKEAYNSADVNCEWKTKIKETFPDIEFERKLPESWGEYAIEEGCEFDNMSNIEYYKGIKSTITNNKYTALRKLELLRDYYNDGWKPDWMNDKNKSCIYKYENDIKRHDVALKTNWFLYFKSRKLRDTFLTNFKDLIIQAEDLI